MMKQSVGDAMREAGAPFLFAPSEGPHSLTTTAGGRRRSSR